MNFLLCHFITRNFCTVRFVFFCNGCVIYRKAKPFICLYEKANYVHQIHFLATQITSKTNVNENAFPTDLSFTRKNLVHGQLKGVYVMYKCVAFVIPKKELRVAKDKPSSILNLFFPVYFFQLIPIDIFEELQICLSFDYFHRPSGIW